MARNKRQWVTGPAVQILIAGRAMRKGDELMVVSHDAFSHTTPTHCRIVELDWGDKEFFLPLRVVICGDSPQRTHWIAGDAVEAWYRRVVDK